MNVFVVNEDPVISARELCDAHVVKMPTETAQLLSTAHRVLDGKQVIRPSVSGKRMVKYFDLFEGIDDLEMEMLLYKANHINHPSAVWARESSANYLWLYKHFVALCDEYNRRYCRTHKSDTMLRCALATLPRNIKQGTMTPFPQAMPDDCKQSDPVQAYRTYYNKYKASFAKWKYTRAPSWFDGAVA